MGKIIRNGITYTGGGSGSTTTRYVNNENDENYGWVQYKEADGTWVNWKNLGFSDDYVIKNGVLNEKYNFVINNTHSSLSTSITFTQEDGYVLLNKPGDSKTGGLVSSVSIDVTNYTKMVVTLSECSSCDLSIGVSSTTPNANPIAVIQVINASGTYTLDLSSVSQPVYAYFQLHNTKTTTAKITDMHFE